MLLFSNGQMRRLSARKMETFRERLNAWLITEHATWAGLDTPARQDALQAMITAADRAGMTVETDYAVFCGVLVSSPGAGVDNWRAALTRPEITKVLDSDWQPAAKLVRMERLLATRQEIKA